MTASPEANGFFYQERFPVGGDATRYRLLTREGLRPASFAGKDVLVVEPEVLVRLAREAVRDVSFLLRPAHLEQLASILKDPEASAADKEVALALLRNSVIASQFVLPMCQDTGTAIVAAKKGHRVWTDADDAMHLSKGIWQTFTQENLRHSQIVPLGMYEEKNSGNNLPAQIDIQAVEGMTYEFLFLTKGGGSANKTYLFQEKPALLHPAKLREFLREKIQSLGAGACPPYHLVFVIGGSSAEDCLKTVKLASAGFLDALPARGSPSGQAFRDRRLEQDAQRFARETGLGAQFGGKHLAHDVRVIRLPRHSASLPIGMGVSCSADRNVRARIDRNGVWLEELEGDPRRYIPQECRKKAMLEDAVRIDLDRPMPQILAELSRHPVSTRLSLTGRLITARDLVHAKLRERLERGEGLPAYVKDHPIYYAGPSQTPAGKPAGSFGPTTAARMDGYVEPLQALGGSLIMLGKGDRSAQVAEACRKHGGFYLGLIGGAGALTCEDHIRKVETLDFQELGMEAVCAVDVADLPAFLLIDDKGNDFFRRPGYV